MTATSGGNKAPDTGKFAANILLSDTGIPPRIGGLEVLAWRYSCSVYVSHHKDKQTFQYDKIFMQKKKYGVPCARGDTYL